jgi:hypothetical protein
MDYAPPRERRALRLRRARVLVTGGSNGIGLAVARGFADAGAHVTITGRRASAGDYAHDLTAFAYRPLDVRDAAAVDALAADARWPRRPREQRRRELRREPSEWDPAVFEESLRINLSSAFRLSVACKALLAASRLEAARAC